MSADNWTSCPACYQAAVCAYENARDAITADYGQVPMEEFEKRRAALEQPDRESQAFRTFREDYEFYGANEGTVHWNYKGCCSNCNLSVEETGSKNFYHGVIR